MLNWNQGHTVVVMVGGSGGRGAKKGGVGAKKGVGGNFWGEGGWMAKTFSGRVVRVMWRGGMVKFAKKNWCWYNSKWGGVSSFGWQIK